MCTVGECQSRAMLRDKGSSQIWIRWRSPRFCIRVASARCKALLAERPRSCAASRPPPPNHGSSSN